MRAREFVFETRDVPGDGKKLTKDQQASMRNIISMPDISMNKSNGNFYQQMRFFMAMAGAHPDEKLSAPTPEANAFSGDPAMAPYTDEDFGIMKTAGKMVGAGRMIKMVNNKSQERDDTHKVSPVSNWNPRNKKK